MSDLEISQNPIQKSDSRNLFSGESFHVEENLQQLGALFKDNNHSSSNVMKDFGNLELVNGGSTTSGKRSESVLVETSGRDGLAVPAANDIPEAQPRKKDTHSDSGPPKETLSQLTLEKLIGKNGLDIDLPKAGPNAAPQSRKQGIAQ